MRDIIHRNIRFIRNEVRNPPNSEDDRDSYSFLYDPFTKASKGKKFGGGVGMEEPGEQFPWE